MQIKPSKRTLGMLALAVGFALAHTQSPLFYSNQNQYLLHGLANAGYGKLDTDWLANTRDPTPLFSFAVSNIYQIFRLNGIKAAFFVLLMVYFLAAWYLAVQTHALRPSRPVTIFFAAIFTLVHSALLRYESVQLFGTDYPWYLQSGLAGQYILGPGLQPSVFGILLVISVGIFARGRPVFAAVVGASAALIHATYLFPAALLTIGYLIELALRRRIKTAFAAGVAALGIALPVVIYTLIIFPPTSAGEFAEAQRILAEIRIPHHAVVARWLDGIALLQIAWIALGIFLLRKTILARPLAVASLLAISLTLLQIATGNHTLALLFPWRISTILVPIATIAVIASVSRNIPPLRWTTRSAIIVFLVAIVGGSAIVVMNLGYQMNELEQPLYDFITRYHVDENVYLIPTRIPPLSSGRGSISATFMPPPGPRPGSNLIPVDLQRFRLMVGEPIFVDFKSVPYADREVLEWLRRMKLVEKWYDTEDWDRGGVLQELEREGISHVIIPRAAKIHANFLRPIYARDDAYGLFEVVPTR